MLDRRFLLCDTLQAGHPGRLDNPENPMPKPSTFVAQMPDNTTVKRTSVSRTYTHVVVGRHDARQMLSCDVRFINSPVALSNYNYARRKDGLPALAAVDPEYVAFREARLIEAYDNIERLKEVGYFATWHAISWVGRPELCEARERAAAASGWIDVRSIPAERAA